MDEADKTLLGQLGFNSALAMNLLNLLLDNGVITKREWANLLQQADAEAREIAGTSPLSISRLDDLQAILDTPDDSSA